MEPGEGERVGRAPSINGFVGHSEEFRFQSMNNMKRLKYFNQGCISIWFMFYKEHSKELVDKIFIIIYCCLTVILKFINLEQQTSQ